MYRKRDFFNRLQYPKKNKLISECCTTKRKTRSTTKPIAAATIMAALILVLCWGLLVIGNAYGATSTTTPV